MGTSGWDDDARGRSRSSRDGRPREGERLPGRSSERAGYEYDRSGRVRSRDDGWSDTDRSRSYSGRGERDYGRGPGASSFPGGPGSSGKNRRPAREDIDEYGDGGTRNGRGGSSRADWERSDERSARGQRPPQRGEAWDAQQRRGPGSSGSRSSSSGRGGLWGDDTDMRVRRPGRPGGSDPRGRSMGGARPNTRDPRALRRGLASAQAGREEPEEKSGVGCAQAILIVVVMFLVGAGGGFALFKMTAPKINADTVTPAATSAPATTPNASPQASPSATPKTDTSHIWVASNAPYGI